MTRILKRLPEEVFEKVFAFVLEIAVKYGLFKGKTIAVDSTTLEANAAIIISHWCGAIPVRTGRRTYAAWRRPSLGRRCLKCWP